MKRKVGITALIFAGTFYLLSLAASISRSTGLYVFTMVMFWGCGITATICLFGDFIRYIGNPPISFVIRIMTVNTYTYECISHIFMDYILDTPHHSLPSVGNL